MKPGDRVHVAHRKGEFTLLRPIRGGWQTLSPRQRIEAVRDDVIKEKTAR